MGDNVNMNVVKKLLFIAILLNTTYTMGQTEDELPYRQIPAYPTDYNAGNLLSRMIDGLGYRYYWATEGLTEKDLQYIPSESGRSCISTIEHIYVLSQAIVNAPQNQPNVRPLPKLELSYEALRKQTLLNLKKASTLCAGETEEEIASYKVIFKRGEKEYEFPLWNLINGQISDAIYHVGQIVIFRRASGNPLNSKVDVFMGKNRGE